MDPSSRHGLGQRFAVLGMVVNALLAIVKLIAGLLGHSYALIADAVESMADIFGSIVIWGGLRIASLPADRNHPYGHGKAEPLAALFVALALFGAGAGIAVQAVREIIQPHHPPSAFTLPVLIGVVIVKELLFRLVERGARRIDSGAVMVDAWHHRSDAITSLAAAVGISIALIGGPAWAPADDWAALVASGVIIFNAYKLVQVPLAELMDAEPTAMIDRVRSIAAAVPDVQGVEKVFARKSGMSYWIDMHVEVAPAMPVLRAHEISHQVKDAVRAAIPQISDVLIHIEPFGISASGKPHEWAG